jgi:hypothetical protein
MLVPAVGAAEAGAVMAVEVAEDPASRTAVVVEVAEVVAAAWADLAEAVPPWDPAAPWGVHSMAAAVRQAARSIAVPGLADLLPETSTAGRIVVGTAGRG